MTTRVAFAGFSHETNDFSPRTTDVRDFTDHGYYVGDEIETLRGTNTEAGGVMQAAEEDGDVEVIPIVVASATPGGLVTRAAFELLTGQIEEGIAREKPDAVCLDLHGAMVAEGEDDGDGAILRRVRQIVGPDIPVVAVLDLHANVGPEMIEYADALIPYDEYPHIDMAERGAEGLRLVVDAARGKVRPTMGHVKLPMMPNGPKQFSRIEPTKSIMEHVHEIETRPGVLTAGVCFAFPYADCPHGGMTITVVTDGDQNLADSLAREIADEIWERREEFRPVVFTVEEAVRHAIEQDNGPIVLADYGDNPGGGGAGDGTELLRGFLELGAKNAAFALIADPETVQEAFEAGIGSEISVDLGGKTDDLHGAPIPVVATVRHLSDGTYIHAGPMMEGVPDSLGPTAVLGCKGRYGDEVEVVVTTIRRQPFDTAVFTSQGIDPSKKKIIGVKSAVHFRNAYVPIAAEILEVDTPGLTAMDFSRFNYSRLPRPMWPLDDVWSAGTSGI